MKGVFGCYRNTIRLRSGVYFDLADPKPEHFRFTDIAGALSKICRFGGQIEWFYSVAEHLYHCAEQAAEDKLPIEVQRAILLHDAAEAFVGDVVKPLKVMLPQYKEIESRIESVIAEKFGVDFSHPAVDQIDREMLIAERNALFTKDDVEWTGEREVRHINRRFYKWSPGAAEHGFLAAALAVGINVNI